MWPGSTGRAGNSCAIRASIKARFLPPIPPGLPREDFMQRLISETEAACDQMLIEAAQGPNPPDLPPTAVQRLKELGVA